ncbi:uncharacterized protein MKK02DRAFT_21065 [Dioszegia hungarica]|uniref:Transmembrane protein 135 N-terminal domain-containing protein n=1 Tax=Dioszegia hungarica TaxID=4972 RepID=A0AA38H3F9_9TREE|nr:uncharacterized protein MKK02DRAFT_21065 [Dioszegia hungarica]KAI9632051.1 hypothetical protein MKK02DRAFT_21065 [Dioszegia hungarica]
MSTPEPSSPESLDGPSVPVDTPQRSKTAPLPHKLDEPGSEPEQEGTSSTAQPAQSFALGPVVTTPSKTSPAPSVAPDETSSDNALSLRLSKTPSPPKPPPLPALRRTASNLSSGSSGGGAGREKKRLRFTQISPDGEEREKEEGEEEGVFFPGSSSYEDAEAGRGKGKRRIPPDQGWLRSDPGTPNLAETADQIKRTLSLARLDTLLQANERDRLLAEVSRAGLELVWRNKDAKKLYPRDPERAGILALKRGLRSFLLAFSVRAGVNVLLLLFRTLRRKGLRVQLILHAIFGAEPFRFGATIGTFTFLNTLTLHLLRLAPPLSYLRRRFRAGFNHKPSFGPPEREGAEGERRWQAAVAGAVGSLGLLWETKARRRGVAQQMFVRGLQGSYNQYAPKMGVRIPHGDVLLFGLCCGQIMFAWLLSPETIPREYNKWILSAFRGPECAVLANRTAVRQGIIEPAHIQMALDHKHVTPGNTVRLRRFLEMAKEGQGWKVPATIPCEILHPATDGCVENNFKRFFEVFRFMVPAYSALHLIPTLVLRRQSLQRDPLRILLRVVLGITRSCSFLGGFVFIYHALFCLRSQTILQGWSPKWAERGLRRKETFWGIGFATCASLFLEDKKRRAELAMYVLPRALESAWSTLRKRAYVPIVPFGETILGAAAMAMVMDAYKHQPGALSGIVRRLMFQLVGPV